MARDVENLAVKLDNNFTYPLRPAAATLLTKVCSTVTRQPIELKSCSNHLRIRQVFSFRWKKQFFPFGFGVLWGWRHNGGIFSRLFGQVYLALGANPMGYFFGSRFDWYLGYHPSFLRPWLTF